MPPYPARKLIVLLLPLLAGGARAGVLHDHDHGPLTGVFGAPDSTESALLVPDGRLAFGVSYSRASHSISESDGEESLYLDGETARLEMRLRYGVTDRLELGLELPVVQHEGGNLDSVIDNWHQWFNLPEGKRPGREQDVLDFRYEAGAVQPISIGESSRGIGDVRLFGGWRLRDGATYRSALRFGVKFPTGDSADLHGSGGTDVSIGLAGDASSLFGVDKLTAFYRVSAIHVGEPDFLADRYREWVGMLSAGVGYELGRYVELRFQAATRSPYFNSDINNLGGNSTTVTFGGNIRLTENYELSIAVSEDVDVSTAPDVSFLLAIRYRDR